ncbi:MAG TPA: hypothetical protein VEH04_18170 [Verrucomicrobiae bacterium]|nr:hypothetical protein [Verrucomicrobiae bacterium]
MNTVTHHSASSAGTRAFTLLEVMIASGILFVCLFAVLGLLANTLRNARALQKVRADASMLAAQLSLTNKLTEGVDSGDFRDLGDNYRDLNWRTETFLAETNGLFAVDLSVFRRSGNTPESRMTILLYRPESTMTPAGGAPRR